MRDAAQAFLGSVMREDIDISEDMEREFSPQRKEQTMANVNYDPAQALNPRVAKEGPMARLQRALNTLEQADKLTDGCADNLCGQVPASEVKPPLDDLPGAMFPALIAMAARIERHAQSITESMNRIQRAGS